MGALVSIFSSDVKTENSIFLDIENSRPTNEKEVEIYEKCQKVLGEGPNILKSIQNYTTCEEVVRKAISSPSPETEKAALVMVLPAVSLMKDYYMYSQELRGTFITLLTALMTEESTHNRALETQQSLAKQLVDTLDFVLQWDDAKMLNPGIQNDFSYYRRSLGRLTKECNDEIVVRDELANVMSLFFASPTPMMNNLTTATTSFLESDASNSNVTRDSVVSGLSAMANICFDMVAKHRFQSTETNVICLRAMTGCIILVDRIHKPGAFNRKSPINIKGCITTLKTYSDESTCGLINALRWNTVHLQDPETPATIKNLLA